MTKIIFEDHAGRRVAVDARLGSTVMEAAISNNVSGIDAECGGACACATCHVYIDPEWLAVVGAPGDTERDMLEFANEVRENSRLSCQIKIQAQLDGLIVRTPETQG
ncbi:MULTISPECIES: 2Fe-2S iron-sulfur cluster-binding protein [Burkholderia]|uniref:2Fe-2S iron-sulfur cluster-binding protein n=1 Tax=Burkholderia TaxID=32008 RepID=UPI002AB320A3|nr:MULTISPECIES: 2Fe-2S iron-sulfur cluster-binding protein [Burkholderia]